MNFYFYVFANFRLFFLDILKDPVFSKPGSYATKWRQVNSASSHCIWTMATFQKGQHTFCNEQSYMNMHLKQKASFYARIRNTQISAPCIYLGSHYSLIYIHRPHLNCSKHFYLSDGMHERHVEINSIRSTDKPADFWWIVCFPSGHSKATVSLTYWRFKEKGGEGPCECWTTAPVTELCPQPRAYLLKDKSSQTPLKEISQTLQYGYWEPQFKWEAKNKK